MAKPDPMGATFAERKAAAEGKASYDDPTPDAPGAEDNTSFADRAKAAKKADAKQVESGAENKAVKKSAAKRK